MLSLQRYAWLCVLGGEVFYAVCLLYGQLLTGTAAELHRSLFAQLMGFSWTTSGIIIGAVDVLVVSFVVGFYIAWMHNYSLISKK